MIFFCKNVKVFTVTSNQFHSSMLNKMFDLFEEKKLSNVTVSLYLSMYVQYLL